MPTAVMSGLMDVASIDQIKIFYRKYLLGNDMEDDKTEMLVFRKYPDFR